MTLLVSMISSHGVIPTFEYVEILREKYSFLLEDEILIPLDEASFLEPPPGKVGVYVRTFDAGYRLPITYFLNEVLRKNGINIYDLTPNALNKVVAFEMMCRSQDFLPSLPVFKNFFRFFTVGDKFTFYTWKNAHVLVPDEKISPKNWKNHWL